MVESSKARICVPVCEADEDRLLLALEKSALVADIVELRLDCVDPQELNNVVSNLLTLASKVDVPLIITLRAPNQGGKTTLDDQERAAFWKQLSDSPFKRCESILGFDIEADLLFNASYQNTWRELGWDRIICSHHDFERTGGDLCDVFDRVSKTPARIIKLAVNSSDVADTLPVFCLLDEAKKQDRNLIAISMGEAGMPTRILGPSRGAFLTFASLDDTSATAPGQLTASTLRSVYRIDSLDEQTKVAGLIGCPVSHSLSPSMHNAAFEYLGIEAVYLPLLVKDLARFFREVVRTETRKIDWPLLGFSVTAPHKTRVIEFLDSVDDRARKIGAVNTVVVDDGQLIGYNTDVEGFIEPLRRRMPEIKGIRAAVLGAGGAARSVIWALNSEGAEVTVFARDVEKARTLCEDFDIVLADISSANFEDFEIVVNATPLGTHLELESESPALAGQLRGARLAYDLVYNPTETRFLREASQAGCEVIGGLEMLVKQAQQQILLWTGQQTPEALILRAAQQALTAS